MGIQTLYVDKQFFKKLGHVINKLHSKEISTGLIWLTLLETCSVTYTCHRFHISDLCCEFTTKIKSSFNLGDSLL